MDEKEKEIEIKTEEVKKDIDVISGDGSEINISPVYDHVILDKPNKKEKKEQIVIPKEIKEEKKKDNTNVDTSSDTNTNSNNN